MTRNSRKKLSLSVKRFPTRKKQMVGGAYSVLSPHVHTSSGIQRLKYEEQQRLTERLYEDGNLLKMLNDPGVRNGGFWGTWESTMTELKILREEYISKITADSTSINDLNQIINKFDSKSNYFYNKNKELTINNNSKSNEVIQSDDLQKIKDIHTYKLNNIRLIILKEMIDLIKKEIKELNNYTIRRRK